MNWKRASEITEPGVYWVDDRRPTGTPSASRDWYVVQVRASDRLYVVNASIAREGWFLERWAKNIFLYGPIDGGQEMTSMERKNRILSKHQVLAMLPKIH
jgi:hypothetical protein